MTKELIIIGFFGLCFGFSVREIKQNSGNVDSGRLQYGKYTYVDVNDTNVQAAAQRVLQALQKDQVCSNFTLLNVKKAKYKLGGAGITYFLKLRFKTADNEIKKCKIKVHGHVIDVSVREESTKSKPKPAPYQNGCSCRDLKPTDFPSEE
ncbi:hypothetical protein CHS0354_008311 [Potamilus streckersoni]|uniref:Cystatin domain-containing protein n=1 Tax=Potamilus streckersoni TaxID=2493646 RepID=A0AAE0VU45_9BIVA|nr:hypothetical protein CHS0354_008311 [Potamilus streckersoni]